jgi:hypothetical protein
MILANELEVIVERLGTEDTAAEIRQTILNTATVWTRNAERTARRVDPNRVDYAKAQVAITNHWEAINQRCDPWLSSPFSQVSTGTITAGLNVVRPPNRNHRAVNELDANADAVARGQQAYSLSIGPEDAVIALSDNEEQEDEDQAMTSEVSKA